MLIGFVYDTVQQPTYISLYVVIYLGMGDIMVEGMFGVLAYCLLEWPATKAINLLLGRSEPQQEENDLEKSIRSETPAPWISPGAAKESLRDH